MTSELGDLHEALQNHSIAGQMPPVWQIFWQRFFQAERLAWSQLNRELGSVVLCCGPTDIHQVLAPVWQRQPVVLIGSALDADKKAVRYRDRLGIGDMTCLAFGPDRHHEMVQLYLQGRLPMPTRTARISHRRQWRADYRLGLLAHPSERV